MWRPRPYARDLVSAAKPCQIFMKCDTGVLYVNLSSKHGVSHNGRSENRHYWRASVNFCLYFHTFSVGVLWNLVWGTCILCCYVNTGLRKAVLRLSTSVSSHLRMHSDAVWCFERTGRPAEIWALRHGVRLSIVAPSLVGENTDTKPTVNERKQTAKEITEVTIRTEEYAIKVETWHLTVDMCDSTVLRTEQALVEVAACNPRRNSHFLKFRCYSGDKSKHSGHDIGNLVPRRCSNFIDETCAPIGIHRHLIEAYCDAIKDGCESSTNGGNDFGKPTSHTSLKKHWGGGRRRGANSTIMSRCKWLFVSGCQCKSPIFRRMGYYFLRDD